MARTNWKYLSVVLVLIIVLGLFLFRNQEVKAAWVLRDGTAVNPVAVCQDGAYFGVAGQSNISSVSVTANLLPGGEVLFSEVFSLPPNPIPELFVTHSDYFYRSWDNAYQPLPIGAEVNFGYDSPGAIPVIATVGDCFINPPGTDVDDAITYQGSLSDGNAPANGAYDFRFRLFNAATNGDQIGPIVSINDLSVANGLFTTNLNFGANAFNGQARWLEIYVRAGNSTGSYTRLSPRQAIKATPYAHSLQPGAVISGTLDNSATLRLVNNVGNGLEIDRAFNGISIGIVNNNGIQIEKADNYGVYVEDARDYGVYAQTSFTNTTAIVGYASADTGYSSGVSGSTSAPGGIGVVGNNYDFATGGVGVRGYTSSGDGYGVAGFQFGYSTFNNNGYWESGGLFGGRNGVIGISEENGGYAVFGHHTGSTGSGWAGSFISDNADGVYVSTPGGQTGLSVVGGSKNAIVPTEDGARLMYAEEAAEVWFSDYGFGQLVDGVAIIEVDPIFAQTVNLEEPYHVFLQTYGDADLYVTNRTPTQFEVHLRDGDDAAEFSYRLVGKRLGFEDDRLERATFADSDPNLFPDMARDSVPQGLQP